MVAMAARFSTYELTSGLAKVLIDINLVKIITNQEIPSDINIYKYPKAICIGNELERHLLYEYQNKDTSKEYGFPLAVRDTPFSRYGHWHSDIKSRGFYIPFCRTANKRVSARTNNGLLEFKVDNARIGYSSYWHNYWKPVHPKQIQSLCGTFTVVDPTFYSEWMPTPPKDADCYYICQATILETKESYQEFETREVNFVIDRGENNDASN